MINIFEIQPNDEPKKPDCKSALLSIFSLFLGGSLRQSPDRDASQFRQGSET